MFRIHTVAGLLPLLATAAGAFLQSWTSQVQCPGSNAFIHAKCQAEVITAKACPDVVAEVQARVAGAKSGHWQDPHNNGTYTALPSINAGMLQLTHLTGNGLYTDKLTLTLETRSGGRCAMFGCSESQVTSFADASTNCCNLRMLLCGSENNCRSVNGDLGTQELSITKSLGAGQDWQACFKTPVLDALPAAVEVAPMTYVQH
mmetsp:Transcript_29733/g.98560  ORF Transcript_29733/g.98560 Transcript_29733/m.98560 type:complete len:203 (+) Transcript_29733:76-684(+)